MKAQSQKISCQHIESLGEIKYQHDFTTWVYKNFQTTCSILQRNVNLYSAALCKLIFVLHRDALFHMAALSTIQPLNVYYPIAMRILRYLLGNFFPYYFKGSVDDPLCTAFSARCLWPNVRNFCRLPFTLQRPAL